MSKIKSRKTLLKRIRITKKGKMLKKLIGMGHLKAKTTVDRKAKKQKLTAQSNKGHKKLFRKLIGQHSKGM
jgi:hypothetical protein